MKRFSIRNIFFVTVFAALCSCGLAARNDIAAVVFIVATSIFLFYVQVRQFRRDSLRPNYVSVIEQLDLLQHLAEFCPTVIGTPPLGIDIETSDIDVACYSDDLGRFLRHCSRFFGEQANYSVVNTTAQDAATTIVRFASHGWNIEIFCQTIPVEMQWGVRHFRIERRILALDERVRTSIREMKRNGLKTEPAFARLLGFQGDPFASLLELESKTDAEILNLLSQNRTT